MRVFVGEFLFWHRLRGKVQNIVDFEEILAERLNSEDFRVVDLFCQPFSHVVAVSQRSLVLVLETLKNLK